MNKHYQSVLDTGIKNAPLDVQYVAVQVSSCHMTIFYEYYTTFEELVRAKGYEEIDPQCYSIISEVWDLKQNKVVYSTDAPIDEDYDTIGLIAASKKYYEEHKDDPALKPKIVPPKTFDLLTEERLMAIATKNSKNI